MEKLYYAKVDGEPDGEDVEAFARGIILADGTKCLPAKLQLLGGNECLVTVMEGKYHQVRRMFDQNGGKVIKLKRIKIGGLALPSDLAEGESRELSADEQELLFCLSDGDK